MKKQLNIEDGETNKTTVLLGKPDAGFRTYGLTRGARARGVPLYSTIRQYPLPSHRQVRIA